MTCDFLYESWSYRGVGSSGGKKASINDIEHGEVARCGRETDDEYIDFIVNGVVYPMDLCKKHKKAKLTDEAIIENDNLLTSGRNFT